MRVPIRSQPGVQYDGPTCFKDACVLFQLHADGDVPPELGHRAGVRLGHPHGHGLDPDQHGRVPTAQRAVRQVGHLLGIAARRQE